MALQDGTAAAAPSCEQLPQDYVRSTAELIAQARRCPTQTAAATAAATTSSKSTPQHPCRESMEASVAGGSSLVIDVCVSASGAAPAAASRQKLASCGQSTADDDKALHSVRSTSAASDGQPVLVERWTLELCKRTNGGKERAVRLSHLHQALRSTLLFSQLQSWLTLAEGKWHVAIGYKLMTAGSAGLGLDFVLPAAGGKRPAVSSFPVACIDGEHVLRVRCTSLPYGSEIPFGTPELAALVAERRQALCNSATVPALSAKPPPPSAADSAGGGGASDDKRQLRAVYKRRSKSLKLSDVFGGASGGSGAGKTTSSSAMATHRHVCERSPEHCASCGAVVGRGMHPAAAEANKRKRKSQSKPRPVSPTLPPTQQQQQQQQQLVHQLSSPPSAQLQLPVQPIRVRSPPRPISAMAVRERLSAGGPNCTANAPECLSSSDSYTSGLPFRQNSAPAACASNTSSMPSSQSDRDSMSATPSPLCSSSLLRNHSLERMTFRKVSHQENPVADSPHPNMVFASHQSPLGLRRRTSWSGPLSTSPLLGTFEESMFGGRLAPGSRVEGYQLQLRGWCMQCRMSSSTVKLGLQTDFYDTDSGAPSPYLGVVASPNESFTISRKGNLQAVLFRPSGTVLRVFVVPYDLSHLERGKTSFIRQRVVSSPLSGAVKPHLLYAIHFSLRRSLSGALHLHKDIRVVFSPLPPDTFSVPTSSAAAASATAPCELVVDTLGPHIPTVTQVQASLLSSSLSSLSSPSSPSLQRVDGRDAAAAFAPREMAAVFATAASAPLPSSLSSSCRALTQAAAASATTPLLSPQEVVRKKQEAAAAVAKCSCATPPPLSSLQVP